MKNDTLGLIIIIAVFAVFALFFALAANGVLVPVVQS